MSPRNSTTPSVTFNAFKRVIKAGGVVRAIPAPGAAAQPRSFFDKLNDWARQDMGAPGLGYIVFESATAGKGPIAKFIPPDVQARIMAKAGIKAGDAVFFAADKPAAAAKLAGAARTRIGEELGLIAKDRFEFCWIVDFPMYEWNEEEKKIGYQYKAKFDPEWRPRYLAAPPGLSVPIILLTITRLIAGGVNGAADRRSAKATMSTSRPSLRLGFFSRRSA